MEHPHPVLAITLAVGATLGVASEQTVDLRLSIILKVISILSFTVAFGYGVWKWTHEYKMHKIAKLEREEVEKQKQKRKAKKQ